MREFSWRLKLQKSKKALLELALNSSDATFVKRRAENLSKRDCRSIGSDMLSVFGTLGRISKEDNFRL